ncbi:hypothetical protein D1AOALGA4SA_4933 [Olavius algarvensis Delta 1 endosymbiont]|nr:hypothetical protein D1AOALGA4SA_4933 [Olavius algarvensis Delta 1 endosymbiont]
MDLRNSAISIADCRLRILDLRNSDHFNCGLQNADFRFGVFYPFKLIERSDSINPQSAIRNPQSAI